MEQTTTATDLAATVQFILEADKLKGVLRKVRPVGASRFENTAEHSWQIALFALSLSQTLSLSVDINRVIQMLLVHDIGEIDEGDKFVFAQEGWDEQKAAELRTVNRVFGLAATATRNKMLLLWHEFDTGKTSEAKVAKAIDRSMPVLLNLSNNGGSWLENGVTYERVVARIKPEIEGGCPTLWAYVEKELEKARLKGFFATS